MGDVVVYLLAGSQPTRLGLLAYPIAGSHAVVSEP
jgi:hypothetical protein